MEANAAGTILITLLRSAKLTDFVVQAEEVLRDAPWVQIGVVGEFSAGKSSLLNALIGRSCLPESTEPTTGRITLIESAHDLVEPAFYAQEADGRRAVGVLEFSDLVLGSRGDALPVLVVPASAALPAGIRFVDTPGLGSLRVLDAYTTLSFAAYLDAILICVDINRGGLSASLNEFLAEPQLAPLRRDAVIVLCKADQKSESGGSAVREAVLSAMRETMSNEEWGRFSEDDRLVVTSAKAALAASDPGIERLRRVLASGFYARRRELANAQQVKTLHEICNRTITTLEQRVENLTVDDTAFRERTRMHRAALGELHSQRERAEAAFYELSGRLASQLQTVARPYAIRIASPDKLVRHQAAADLLEALSSAARQGVSAYVGEVGTLPATADLSYLSQRIDRIYSVRDMAVTVSTALVVAALSSGASLSANAAEAVVGAAGRAGANAARSVSTANLLGKFLAVAGDIVRDVNPLELIGDELARGRATGAAITELERVAADVSSSVMQHLRQSYLENVLGAAEEQLTRVTRELEATEHERAMARDAVVEHQRNLRIVIRDLRAWKEDHTDDCAT